MFRRSKSTIMLALPIAVIAALLVVNPALAADSGIGVNIGHEVDAWARGLLLGTATLVGLPALARRDMGQGLVIVILTILIGGFVWAGPQVEGAMSTLWNSVAGTSTSQTTTTSDDCGQPTPQVKC
jgi:hypothetical protein